MRTTLTLEDDVATELARLSEGQGKSFKQVVNEVLRAGLIVVQTPRGRRARYRTKPVSVGRCLVPSLDNVGDMLDFLDEEEQLRP